MFTISLDEMRVAFEKLGRKAAEAGKVIDLCVYGGSCLMMVSNFRVSTADVDAVATTDQGFIDAAAAAIASELSWPPDWLNDGVRTFLSPNVEGPQGHALSGTYPSEQEPGLRVYTPTAEYMLAMKLMAMRIDEYGDTGKDLEDILNLMSVVGIGSRADLIAIATDYYPEARTSAKLHLSADALIAQGRLLEETRREPARYADRGGRGHGR